MNKNIKNVIITEVGTRDGFQSEKKTIDTQDKILLIDDLVDAADQIEQPSGLDILAEAAQEDDRGLDLDDLIAAAEKIQNTNLRF